MSGRRIGRSRQDETRNQAKSTDVAVYPLTLRLRYDGTGWIALADMRSDLGDASCLCALAGVAKDLLGDEHQDIAPGAGHVLHLRHAAQLFRELKVRTT